MNIFERAHHLLSRNYANSPKVAVLFFVHAAGWFALEVIGVNDLASPWLVLTLIPIILIYTAERQHKLKWFRGMTAPSLLVMVGMVAFVWLLNTDLNIPDAFMYCALAGWLAAFAFLAFRIWTFEMPGRPIP